MRVIENLPSLTEEDLASLDRKDSSCPICLAPFLTILASEETALALESPPTTTEELGVTRLVDTCGHVFCRKDIVTWIKQHDSCPMCRRSVIKRSTDIVTTADIVRRIQQLDSFDSLPREIAALREMSERLRIRIEEL